MTERLLKINEVKSMTGLGHTTIYKMMNEGKFPVRVKCGKTALWPLSEVLSWIQLLKDVRDSKS